MSIFKGTNYKEGTKLQGNTLYCTANTVSFEMYENECNDSDIIRVIICMDHYDEAVFGKEYRAPFIDKNNAKRADLMCILINNHDEQITSYVYEVKHIVSGTDMALKALDQILGSIRQVISMIYNAELDRFHDSMKIGIITSRIEYDGIKETLKSYKENNENTEKERNTIEHKMRVRSLLDKRKYYVISNFLKGKLEYEDIEYQLDFVYLLPIDNAYECELTLGT